jgi:hypothetical protein
MAIGKFNASIIILLSIYVDFRFGFGTKYEAVPCLFYGLPE